MAREVVKRKPRPAKRFEDMAADIPRPIKKNTDVESILDHLRTNLLMYVGSAAFIGVAILAGILFRVGTTASKQEVASEFARALTYEDPAERLAALETLQGREGFLAAEVKYMIGETAYQAGEYDRAREAFARVRSEHAGTPFAAEALEGLGFIAEDDGELDQALAYYQDAAAQTGTFAARRQHFNMARVYEKQGRIEDAVQAYQEQQFAFPDSMVAQNAAAALGRLRASHPEAFPVEEVSPAVSAPLTFDGLDLFGEPAPVTEAVEDDAATDDSATTEAAETTEVGDGDPSVSDESEALDERP